MIQLWPGSLIRCIEKMPVLEVEVQRQRYDMSLRLVNRSAVLSIPRKQRIVFELLSVGCRIIPPLVPVIELRPKT